jgi:hypothetical protein
VSHMRDVRRDPDLEHQATRWIITHCSLFSVKHTSSGQVGKRPVLDWEDPAINARSAEGVDASVDPACHVA